MPERCPTLFTIDDFIVHVQRIVPHGLLRFVWLDGRTGNSIRSPARLSADLFRTVALALPPVEILDVDAAIVSCRYPRQCPCWSQQKRHGADGTPAPDPAPAVPAVRAEPQ